MHSRRSPLHRGGPRPVGKDVVVREEEVWIAALEDDHLHVRIGLELADELR